MYFNKNIILPGLLIVSLPHVAIAGTCSQSVVKAASDAEFLEYVLLNCVGKAKATPSISIRDKTVLDPQSCVASFPTKFGATGACLNDYVTLVANIQSYVIATRSPFEATGADVGCQYDAANGIQMSYRCWDTLASGLLTFYKSAGYPVQLGVCDPIMVRSQTLANLFPQAIKDTLIASSGTGTTAAIDYAASPTTPATQGTKFIVPSQWKKSSTGYTARVEFNDGLCLGSYQVLLDILQGKDTGNFLAGWGLKAIGTAALGPKDGWLDNTLAAPNDPLSTLMNSCRTDPASSGCANSPVMMGFKRLFTDLSGSDIGFTGPICDANVIASKVDNSGIRPTPYQYFVMCGLMASQNPDLCSTDAVTQYVATLMAAVGPDCLGCYDEMSRAIVGLASNSSARTACNSYGNVTSDACVAALSPVASAFKQCTGSDLYTKLPSSIPSGSNVPSGTGNTTTNGTASNGSDLQTSRALINSGMLIVIAVLTYLM